MDALKGAIGTAETGERIARAAAASIAANLALFECPILFMGLVDVFLVGSL